MPITVTAYDSETGEVASRDLDAGEYALIAAEPLYLDQVVTYANGTRILTVKRRKT